VGESKGRGGARAGAGRPRLGATRTRRRSVTLEEAHWRWLDATGNASATLRELVRRELRGDYARAVTLLAAAERDFGADVLAKIAAFLHER